MGYRHISEITGRSELLIRNPSLIGRANLVDVSKFIRPDMAVPGLVERYPQNGSYVGVCATTPSKLNDRIVEAAMDAIESARDADLWFRIRNADRSVGATIAGRIAKMYGREGIPNRRRVRVRFEGEAGQSFGAWCIDGLELELLGVAQDGLAKGICGGTVVVTLDYTSNDFGGVVQSVAGNNIGYGATGGKVFVGGQAGHRLGIRNSGATIVAEGAGKYACEYMTRGKVLILGPIENEIGSGMTGGELYVFDPKNEVPRKIHTRSVAVVDCNYVDYDWIHSTAIEYHGRTQSRQAQRMLRSWVEVRRGKRLRKIVPLSVARMAENYASSGTNAG